MSRKICGRADPIPCRSSRRNDHDRQPVTADGPDFIQPDRGGEALCPRGQAAQRDRPGPGAGGEPDHPAGGHPGPDRPGRAGGPPGQGHLCLPPGGGDRGLRLRPAQPGPGPAAGPV